MNTKKYLGRNSRARRNRQQTRVVKDYKGALDRENPITKNSQQKFNAAETPEPSRSVLAERNGPSSQGHSGVQTLMCNRTISSEFCELSRMSLDDTITAIPGPSIVDESEPRSSFLMTTTGVSLESDSLDTDKHNESVAGDSDHIEVYEIPKTEQEAVSGLTSLLWDQDISLNGRYSGIGDGIFDNKAEVEESFSVAENGANDENFRGSGPDSNFANFQIEARAYYYAEPTSGLIADTRSPIDEVRRNIAELDDGDAVFSVQLDTVLDKLVYALVDLDSAYLFRDFAGHFTEFLDRFGPGGFDSHRAPAKAGWIVCLLLPLIHADNDATDARVRVYSEVSGWLQRVVSCLGARNADVFLNGGAWERCVEHMSSLRSEIAQVAFETASTIMRTVPLEYNLVLKVVLMEPLDLGLEDSKLCGFRLYRVKLLSVLLERIDQASRSGEEHQSASLVPDIIRALEKFKSEESDVRVLNSLNICLRYAQETSVGSHGAALALLSPRTRRPHLSLTLTRWQQQELEVDKEPVRKRKPRLLSRFKWFRRRLEDEQGLNETAEPPCAKDDAASVQTSRSTRTLRQRWQELFSSSARSPRICNASDAHSVVTI